MAFAVANRQTVTVSFDPFSSASPAYAATLPLFVVIFVVLILGVMVGGIAAWIRQGKWRRAARRLDGEVRALHQRDGRHPPPLWHGRDSRRPRRSHPAGGHPAAVALTSALGSALRRRG